MQNASFKKSISDCIKEVRAGIWIFCTCLERVLSLTCAGEQHKKSGAKDDTTSTTEMSQLVQVVILE